MPALARGDVNASRPEQSETLSAEQTVKVKQILSGYDAASLSAEDALAIHEAFRAAGLRGGPSMNAAVTSAGFDPDKLRDLAPPPDAQQGSGAEPRGRQSQNQDNRYSVDQAVSDRAQLNTIAFDGVAFLTGDMACNTFLPPGKVADFCGFQYMRDVDVNELGHNTSFVPLIANNVLSILTDAQKDQLIALAQEQEPVLADFGYKRFPLVQAFYRQLTGDIPANSAGLNRDAVMDYTAGFYELDGLLSYRRAEVLGSIIRSLTDEQKAYLSKMSFNDSSTWPELENQVDKQSMSHAAHVAVMTYASEMFSWYAGGVEADVYFCPERHATYFGSFFMKDIPAMGDDNYTISTSLTGDSGEAFLNLLTEDQRTWVTGLVDQQRADLNEIVQVRRQIATLLRGFQTSGKVDKEKVMALSRRYGELDGEISCFYAKAFAAVAESLSADQKTTLMKLRNLDPRYTPKGAFLYSEPIEMPKIPATDFLFASTATTKPLKTPQAKTVSSFQLTSPAVEDGGMLPVDFTGDGAAATLPLSWSGAPEGTKSFSVIMHHIAPDQTKWYWILYNIPATTAALPRNVQEGIGILGNNSVNGKTEYAPPHSKGPGAKNYIYTVYALSAPVSVSVEPEQVNRDVLLDAMKGKILAIAELKTVYERNVSDTPEPRPER
jgi:Raf kinase inhibitor-like YbhB/YbcL family protein